MDLFARILHGAADMQHILKGMVITDGTPFGFQVAACMGYCWFSKVVTALVLNNSPVFITNDAYFVTFLVCLACYLSPLGVLLRSAPGRLVVANLFAVGKGWGVLRAVHAPETSLGGGVVLGICVAIAGDLFADILRLFLHAGRPRPSPPQMSLLGHRAWTVTLAGVSLALLTRLHPEEYLPDLGLASPFQVGQWFEDAHLTIVRWAS
eukprot:CAMPEP_0119137206 /NCGR_PEP_ID=MMETSP1310-20130426/23161_1 /TAXON_ID=464262 /ORGANISM="Genus nov. species nov., Strain RCC2339" /LENGTH=207 /DNA_ID=CAMNT_0007128273 /DNA_START=22 /DNA_END=641 /DNA_ORIENTATION=+